MAPWILGLQQQAQRPMQSKTRIIVFSVKDSILKFSHTMAISEFWCLGRHLATKVFSLLLHTNKFRKTGTLVFRTKLCYMSSCSTSPVNKGHTILWTWQICGSNYFYDSQVWLVNTEHSHRMGRHRTYLSLYPLTSMVSPVQAIMIHCNGTMNARNATTSTAADAK